jgi:hypothetical protein
MDFYTSVNQMILVSQFDLRRRAANSHYLSTKWGLFLNLRSPRIVARIDCNNSQQLVGGVIHGLAVNDRRT